MGEKESNKANATRAEVRDWEVEDNRMTEKKNVHKSGGSQKQNDDNLLKCLR